MPVINFANTTAVQKISLAPGEVPSFSIGTKIDGGRAYCRLNGNSLSSNLPQYVGSNFKELADSLGFDNRLDVPNLIEFFCDGVDVWFKVSQPKGALPRFKNQSLAPLSTSNIKVVAGSSDTYTSNSATPALPDSLYRPFDGLILLSKIPAGKACRVTVRCTQASILGFVTSPTGATPNLPSVDPFASPPSSPLLPYRNSAACPWFAWVGPQDPPSSTSYPIYTGQGLPSEGVNSQVFVSSPNDPPEVFLRLTRTCAGTILVEVQPSTLAVSGLPDPALWQIIPRESGKIASSFLQKKSSTDIYVFAALSTRWGLTQATTKPMKMKFISLEVEE
jgi:hypothetical protein